MARNKTRVSTRTMERHHRRPRSRGGTHLSKGKRQNIIIVDSAHHHAWHLLFGNMDADEVAAMISDTWIDPDYYLVAVPRDRNIKNKRRTRCFCIECEAEVLKKIAVCTKKGG